MSASARPARPLSPPPALETARLRLRPPRMEDAGEIFARYAQDAEVTRYLTWRPHKGVETVQEFLRRLLALLEQGALLPWVVEAQADRRLLGVMDLRLQEHRVEIGRASCRERVSVVV